MKTTYTVNGMTCGGCAASITKALQARDGALSVEVDWKNNTVTVEGLSTEVVEQAVEDAGFDYVGPLQG